MNIIKQVNWVKLAILTIVLSLSVTVVKAATNYNNFKFTVSSPKSGETLIKGDTENIIWTITGTEDNLESLIAQNRISRIYLMEKVYKKSGATTVKITKLLDDIPLDGEIECNDAHTVCSLNQNYDWTISSKFKTGSKYFIKVYLRPQPNLFSGLAKFFTLNNRYVFNDTGVFTIKAKNETITVAPSITTQTACSPKLKYIQTNDSTQSCCSGLKACKLSDSAQAICLSDCDAATVKSETSLLSSIIKVEGEVDATNSLFVYPSSLIPDSQTEGASLEHPNFQISKNADGTYKIHWFNGAFGPGNVVQTIIKDAVGTIVFDSNKVRLPDSGFADFDVKLDGKQKYTIVLDKIFGSDKNIEYIFDSSLINGGTKIINNILNKSFTTSDSFLSFLNTAISADGKSFGIDFDLKNIYGLNATRPVRKIIVTLSDGTKQTLNIDDNFLAQQNKGMVLPITGTDKTFQIDLYDINGNKIESKTLGIASNQNITLVTDYKGATGWKSVYDPSISLSSVGMYGTTSWKKYTINYDAAGASKIVLTDANGIIISSTNGSSMTLTDKQMLANHGYYLNFYDGSGKLAHTEYINVDSKSNFTNISLTDPSIYFTACGGGRYYLPYNLVNQAKGADGSTPVFSFVGEGGASAITYNKDGYIDASQIKDGQQFTMTYTDPVDGKVHTYTVTVTSDKLSNGGLRLSYVENSVTVVTALSCSKQGKVCLDTSSCKAGSSVGKLDCDGSKVCCFDKCESPKVSCNGNCINALTVNNVDSCGSCGIKCDTTKSETCELKDSKYQCLAKAADTTKKPCLLGTTTYKNGEIVHCPAGQCNGDMKCDDGVWVANTNSGTKASCTSNGVKYEDGKSIDCLVGKCAGSQKCNNGTFDSCIKKEINCDEATGNFVQPKCTNCKNGCASDEIVDDSKSCDGNNVCCRKKTSIQSCTSNPGYSCQDAVTGSCETGTKISNTDCEAGVIGWICCKAKTATPVVVTKSCTSYGSGFQCMDSGAGVCDNATIKTDTTCSTGNIDYVCCKAKIVTPIPTPEPVIKHKGCVVGQCIYINGVGTDECSVIGQACTSKTPTPTPTPTPCVLGTTPCGSNCCTADKECISGICTPKANGCTACNTAACGNCTNGYLCSCTLPVVGGTGFKSCTGGTTKNPACPSGVDVEPCSGGYIPCGASCCTNKSASVLNIFNFLKQIILKWFK
jgi:hypothetical protein